MHHTNILVPIDYGDASRRGLDAAIELARTMGGRLTVVHAYEVPYVLDLAVLAEDDPIARIVREEAKRLDALLDEYAKKGVRLEPVLRRGRAFEVIIAVAEEIGADLVVVGTHGPHGLPRALLGSVADKIARLAPCDVLIVRPPKR